MRLGEPLPVLGLPRFIAPAVAVLALMIAAFVVAGAIDVS
jgi:hypothetical protein